MHRTRPGPVIPTQGRRCTRPGSTAWDDGAEVENATRAMMASDQKHCMGRRLHSADEETPQRQEEETRRPCDARDAPEEHQDRDDDHEVVAAAAPQVVLREPNPARQVVDHLLPVADEEVGADDEEDPQDHVSGVRRTRRAYRAPP